MYTGSHQLVGAHEASRELLKGPYRYLIMTLIHHRQESYTSSASTIESSSARPLAPVLDKRPMLRALSKTADILNRVLSGLLEGRSDWLIGFQPRSGDLASP